jgi:Mg2+-importing ATPase
LAQYSEDALTNKCQDTTIFARFSPQQKERVIHHLQEGGQVIGYLGDGINDAPSLITADVGISVENAVDVAKESADMILTTKSLQQLIDGVLEGRQIFANTMKYIMMGMSSNFGNMFSVLIGVFFLPFLPMLPIQILLNNFLYDLSQIAIPTDSVDPEMVQQPRRWNMTFIKRFMYVFGPISSLFDIITYVVLLRVFHVGPALFWAGWFMESLATQTLVIFSIRTRRVPFFRSPINWLVGGSAIAIVALGWFITLGPLHAFFEFGQPSLPLVFSIVLIVATYLVLVEIGKVIFYRWLVPAED